MNSPMTSCAQSGIWRTMLGLGVLACLLSVGCSESESPTNATTAGTRTAEENAATPVIVASIHPLASVAESIMEGHARVHTLLPAERSPHGFSVSASQMQVLSKADLVIANGLGVDAWAISAAKTAGVPADRILVLAKLITEQHESRVRGGIHDHASPAHEHEHEHEDDHKAHEHEQHTHDAAAHLWLDPKVMLDAVEALLPRMRERLKKQQQNIDEYGRQFLMQLEELDRTYTEQLDKVPVKQMVTFHNAFDAMAAEYGLEVVAHLSEVSVHGPSVTAGELRSVEDMLTKYDLQVIYAEPQMPQTAVQAVREKIQVQVLILDPLGQPGESYADLMKRNLQTLVKGQSQQAK